MLVALTSLAGCAQMLTVDARIEGRVLLEGLSSGQLGGTQIVLDGNKTAYTDQNGNFSIEGKISGGDDFELVINRSGFVSMQIIGTLAYDTDVEMNVTSVGTVTLPSI
jgi:hypothetical protein